MISRHCLNRFSRKHCRRRLSVWSLCSKQSCKQSCHTSCTISFSVRPFHRNCRHIMKLMSNVFQPSTHPSTRTSLPHASLSIVLHRLRTVYLKSKGIDPKTHPVIPELVRDHAPLINLNCHSTDNSAIRTESANTLKKYQMPRIPPLVSPKLHSHLCIPDLFHFFFCPSFAHLISFF